MRQIVETSTNSTFTKGTWFHPVKDAIPKLAALPVNAPVEAIHALTIQGEKDISPAVQPTKISKLQNPSLLFPGERSGVIFVDPTTKLQVGWVNPKAVDQMQAGKKGHNVVRETTISNADKARIRQDYGLDAGVAITRIKGKVVAKINGKWIPINNLRINNS